MLFLESCSTVRSTWLAPRPRSAIRLKLTYGTGSDILYINPMFPNPLVSCMYPLPLYEEEFLAGTHVIANIQKVWEIVRLNNFVKLFCPFCAWEIVKHNPDEYATGRRAVQSCACRRNCVCTCMYRLYGHHVGNCSWLALALGTIHEQNEQSEHFSVFCSCEQVVNNSGHFPNCVSNCVLHNFPNLLVS